MSLKPGTTLGPYEVIEPIGVGGMGEVYRARDTKLNRDVALKVLPEAFVTDPERLARFQREAEVLASLNHPNIAPDLWTRRQRWHHRARPRARRRSDARRSDCPRADPAR